ncbi:MAG TPA: Lyzozyme M1 (1,4-beta-N-acetylmuramidase), partial [Erysipelotrichaceae bacterium]|nr:Lyzozyme M1 (1,4-beta-N-acetylmuramidase) [Erysipelotrichaceae bacterium]
DYNISQAIANDIQVGVYFFSQAVSQKEAEEEAEFTLSCMKKYDIDLPV